MKPFLFLILTVFFATSCQKNQYAVFSENAEAEVLSLTSTKVRASNETSKKLVKKVSTKAHSFLKSKRELRKQLQLKRKSNVETNDGRDFWNSLGKKLKLGILLLGLALIVALFSKAIGIILLLGAGVLVIWGIIEIV